MRTNSIAVAALLSAWIVAVPARADEAASARALESFQQGFYEFGIALAMGDSNVRSEMNDMWARLTRLRETACPRALRKEVADITQAFAVGKDAASHLDDIGRELDKLAGSINVAEAKSRLARAREALEAKNQALLRSECVAVMDAVVEQVVKFPLTEWVDDLRKATAHLNGDITPQRRADALKVLRTLPGVEKYKRRAYTEALQAADEVVAAATEMYVEGQNSSAREQMNRVVRPLAIASKAAPDPATGMRINLMKQQLLEADRLIVREPNYWNNTSGEGFRVLRKTREDIINFLERAPAAGGSPGSGSRE